MTSATDELRRLLDERGVEYEAEDIPSSSVGLHITSWDAGGITWDARSRGKRLYLSADRLITPAQVIAATLGRGTLTADDVRDLIERHSDASGGNGRDFHNGAYVAIADELNATLGSFNCTNSERTGTCHNASKVMDEHGQARFACSECHAWIDSRLLWNPEYRNGESPWVKDCKLNFCPNCGRRIVDPTTNDVDAEVAE